MIFYDSLMIFVFFPNRLWLRYLFLIEHCALLPPPSSLLSLSLAGACSFSVLLAWDLAPGSLDLCALCRYFAPLGGLS